jgi:hypothetical protein
MGDGPIRGGFRSKKWDRPHSVVAPGGAVVIILASMKISAVMITHNEEKRLEAALRSVREIADEIVVVDAESTDITVRIAERHEARVFSRKWTNFADQKNFGNEQAAGPWILSLDADERVSPELRQGDPRPQGRRGAGVRRVLHAAPGLLPRPLDPSLRLVSGPAIAPLPQGQGPVGGRLRPRVAGHRRLGRPALRRPSSLHLRIDRRARRPDQPVLRPGRAEALRPGDNEAASSISPSCRRPVSSSPTSCGSASWTAFRGWSSPS